VMMGLFFVVVGGGGLLGRVLQVQSIEAGYTWFHLCIVYVYVYICD
jgi:hypothetical protein